MPKTIGLTLAVWLAVLLAEPAHPQSYPARPVRIVVPLSTGSASDALARSIAAKLGEVWGQQVVVENMPGANGIIAAQAVAKAAPDGYTLMVCASNHVINAGLYKSLPYDPVKSFTPLAQMAIVPLVLAVHPSLPARNIREFVALAKARPGELVYASPGSGSPTHLAMELLKTVAGVDLVHVPYKAVSQAQTDLLAGQIPMMFIVPHVGVAQARAGRLRLLGISSLQRVSIAPDVPTLDEAGLKGYEVVPWVTMFGPAGLASELVAKISGDVVRIAGTPEMQERMRNLGLEAAVKGPQELRDFLPRDTEKWGDLVRRSGAKIDLGG